MVNHSEGVSRCGWTGTLPLMIDYHDTEWGVPVHDDRKHFEFLVLDAFQAGLSWSIVLRKRDRFRQAFDRFDPEKIARYRAPTIARLLADEGIIRNRLKIAGTVKNARAFLELQEERGSFDAFVWDFVDGVTRHNTWKTMRQVPARTPHSDRLSRALKERGFTFVGSTICYAYMQAAGLVNDHLVSCFRYPALHAGGTRAHKNATRRRVL
ncbi:MAG TPA: DNA-3-methyladenine glycosylase I [Gemmatimonadales bacterium]|nr:DNA-3-methyladenine glycosylase I [Gemmatimonadales bacterium]